MVSFICFLFSFADILGGYRSGYATDVQYRHPDGALPRTVIPRKWKWIFHFKWISGCEVLTVSVFLEYLGLFSGIIQFVFGFAGLCNIGKPRDVFIISMFLQCLFVCIVVIALAINSALYHKNFSSKNLKAPRCWACELEAQFRFQPPVRKVYVWSHFDTCQKKRYYRISLKAGGGKMFWSVANGFDPSDGSVVFALYGSDTPYFELVKRSPYNN